MHNVYNTWYTLHTRPELFDLILIHNTYVTKQHRHLPADHKPETTTDVLPGRAWYSRNLYMTVVITCFYSSGRK